MPTVGRVQRLRVLGIVVGLCLAVLAVLLGTGVRLLTSDDARATGTRTVVPNVIGLSRSEAVAKIEASGLSAAPNPGTWSVVEGSVTRPRNPCGRGEQCRALGRLPHHKDASGMVGTMRRHGTDTTGRTWLSSV